MDLPDKVKMPHVELGNSRTILPGETVVVAGRPDEKIYANFIGSASNAQRGIKILDEVVDKGDVLLSDANLKMFVDGGPVLDINGRLLAIANSSKVRPPLEKDATKEQKREHQNSFGFATRVHVAQRVFAKHLGKLKTTRATAAEASARRSGIAAMVDVAKHSIVSVRRASLEKMPEPDPLDPNGKFPGDSIGSGVIVHASGIVLTNAHLVDTEDVVVTTLDGKSYVGEVIAKKPSKNIALVKLDVPKGTSLPFLRLANSDAALLGERIAALGNRYGHTLFVRVGVLSSKQRSKDVTDQQPTVLPAVTSTETSSCRSGVANTTSTVRTGFFSVCAI